MPKTPRPTDAKLLKGWAMKEWPGDPIAQKRQVDAGYQAIGAAKVSAEKHAAELARRQNNALGRKRGR